MKQLVFYIFGLVRSKECYEIDVNGACYKETGKITKLFKAGETVNGMAIDGFSPLGSDQTIPCPDGTFAYRTGLRYPWQCKRCPPGVICKNGQMKLCPVDYPLSEPGITSEKSCRPCDKGFKCYPGKARELCDVGYKRKSKLLSSPFNLTIGNFSRTIEMENQNSMWNEPYCVLCEAGEYCLAGTVDDSDLIRNENDILPLLCSEGTFNPFEGKASCIPCNAGLGEHCPEGSKSKLEVASSAFCFGPEPKISAGYKVLPPPKSSSHSTISEYQCGKGCEKLRQCIGFHWDGVKCFIKTFKISPIIFEPTVASEEIEEQHLPTEQIDIYNKLTNETLLEYENYTAELFHFVEIEEDNPTVIGLSDVHSSIFGGDEHKVTLLAANFETLVNYTLINFNNGVSFNKQDGVSLPQFQMEQFPIPGRHFSFDRSIALIFN